MLVLTVFATMFKVVGYFNTYKTTDSVEELVWVMLPVTMLVIDIAFLNLGFAAEEALVRFIVGSFDSIEKIAKAFK